MSILDFVKKTRPVMARHSALATYLYALLSTVAEIYGHGTGPDPVVIGSLFSPALTYMAARTLDKRSGAE